jgi:hypothetical protein
MLVGITTRPRGLFPLHNFMPNELPDVAVNLPTAAPAPSQPDITQGMFSAAQLQAPLNQPAATPPAAPAAQPVAYTPTSEELASAQPLDNGAVKYTPTPEELASAHPAGGVSIFDAMTPEEMVANAKANPKEFDPLAAYDALPDSQKAAFHDKAVETFHQLRQSGALTPSIMDMLKNAGKGVADVVKTVADLAERSTELPITLPTAVKSGLTGKDLDTSTFAGALTQAEQQRAGEYLAGQKMAGLGFGQMLTKAAEWTARKMHLTKALKDYTPEDKNNAFVSEMAARHGMARLVKEGINSDIAQELAKEGYGLRPEKVETAASGSPFAWEAAGKVFGAGTSVLADSAAPMLATLAGDASPAGIAAAQEVLHALPRAAGNATAKVIGRTLQGASIVAEKAAEKVESAAPLTGKVVGAAGGAVAGSHVAGHGGALFGIAEGFKRGGEIGEGIATGAGKAAVKASELAEVGRQVATGEGIKSSTAQALRDFSQAVPGAAGQVGAGMALDAALMQATQETPGEKAGFTPFGTIFGGLGAARGVSGRVLSGHIAAPRDWGSAGRPERPENFAQNFPALDVEHNQGYATAPDGVKERFNAIQKFVDGAAPGTQVVYAPRPEAGQEDTLPATLQQSGINPEFADQDGFFTRVQGADGQEHRIVVVRNLEAAPHESRHAMDDVLGNSVVEGLNQDAKQAYADKWNSFKQSYADRLTPTGLQTSDPDGTILRESGWGNAAAKEKIISQTRDALVQEGQNPTDAQVREAAGNAIRAEQGRADQAGQELWQFSLTPEEQSRVVDNYVGGEVRAEHHDAWFKAGQPGTLRGKMGMAVARMLNALGANSTEGRASTYGTPLEGSLVEQANRTAPRPEITPETPTPEGSAASHSEAIGNARRAAAEASNVPLPGANKSQREALGIIAEAIARKQGVKLTGLFAPEEPAASLTSDRETRRAMIEAFRTMPDSAKRMWGKLFFPENVPITGRGNIQIFGWAPEVFAANAHKVSGALNTLAEHGNNLSPYEIDPKTGTFSEQGWRDLYDDVQKFVKNQMGGRTGSGQPLVVPESVTKAGGYAPPARGEVEPLSQDKADFINMLFHAKLPDTGIARQGAINLPLNVAGQKISEATMPGRLEAPAEPRGTFRGAVAARQGVKGAPILEVNPFRNKFENALKAAGIEKPSLIEVNQRLNLKNIKDVELAPEQGQFRANTLALQAGFQPARKAGAPAGEESQAAREWKEKGTDSKYFKSWFGDSRVVDSTGKPLVVYHGTSHDFDTFRLDRAVASNFFGKGHYFTSDLADANRNYAKRSGPDLTHHVEAEKERLMFDREDLTEAEALKLAEAKVVGNNFHVIPAYIKLENPVHVNPKGGTRFEMDYGDETGNESGTAVDLYNAMQSVAPEFGVDAQKLWNDTALAQNGDATAFEVARDIRKSYEWENTDNWDASSEYLRRVFEELGFDGIIQHSPAEEFTRMGISPDAVHVIAFRGDQVKSTDNVGTFKKSDERYQYQPPTSGAKVDDFLKFLHESKPEDYANAVGNYTGKYGKGQTSMSMDAGMSASTPEHIAQLKTAREKFSELATAAMKAKDYPAAVDYTSRAQAAREALEAATDTGGMGDFVRKYYDPEFKAPMGEEQPVQAQPAKKEDKEIELRHWSNTPGLKILDPNFHGTGLTGEERARARDYKKIYVPRTYFGTKDYIKEPSLGPEQYRALVKAKDLYPFQEDPKDLWPSSEEVEKAGYAPMDSKAANTLYENKIFKAGYKGYVHRDASVVAKFDKTPVKYLGNEDLTPRDVQFQPGGDPRAIKSAAVKDPETGKIFEGPMHFYAFEKMEAAGYNPEHLYDNDKFPQGFITNGGEFLDRRQAFTRAEEMDQLLKPKSTGFPKMDAALARYTKNRLISENLDTDNGGTAQLQPSRHFWIHRNGDVLNAPNGHEEGAKEHGLIPADFQDKSGDRDISKVYEAAMANGHVRGVRFGNTIYTSYTKDYDQLPRAVQKTIQRLGEEHAMIHNNGLVEGTKDVPTDIFSQFQPPKPEEFAHEATIEGALAKPGWAILTGTQEAQGPADNAANQANNERLYKSLVAEGHTPIEVSGSYKGVDQGRNFLVTGLTPQEALDWGRKFKQESVLTPNGLTYSDGSVQAPDATKTKIGKDAEKEDFFSRVENGPAFSLGFEERAHPRPEETAAFDELGSKKPLSSKEVGDMSKAQIAAHYPESVIPKKVDDAIPSDIVNSPLAKEAGSREAAVSAFAKKLVEFAKSVEKSSGYQAGLKWYSDFVPRLKKSFGPHAQLMAELLAATSPNNAPDTNFAFANDALEGYKSGRFDKMIKKFGDGLDMIEDGSWEKWINKELKAGNVAEKPPQAGPSEAYFLAHWIAKHNLVPRQSNGALYGMHSVPVMRVFARRWLEQTAGPKTQNFVKNLLGTGHDATIDVWADRTMRRLGYADHQARWRILPKNGTGVSDTDFAFSQEAFRQAAKELGVNADDLQGGLWFAEKQLWANEGWGRLDLGDYRKELAKVDLLNAGIAQRLAAQKAKAKTTKAEQPDLLDLLTPR